jgi:RimJ/RimL family protein N-acetyltransferase
MIQPERISLAGKFADLVPLAVEHAPGLFEIGREEAIWRWMTRPPFADVADARGWIEQALAGQAAGTQLPFAILDRSSGRVAGSTRYMTISVPDCGLEIGWTWLGGEFRRTAINTECKYLLLRHAFETLGCQRVQLKTDARNDVSRRAIERIGARLEGILRKFQATRGDMIRDTAMYSILDSEWPAVKPILEGKLART